jgi:hypothetical protein
MEVPVMFSRFSLRAALITGLSFLAVGSASAQSDVYLEGNAAYSVRGTRSNAAVTASISRVANYCYECIFRVQVILTLSRTPFSPYRGVSGQTIARSSQFLLSPRTYMPNVTASGRTSLPSGRYFPIMLAVDPVTKTIYSGTGFNRQLTARSIAKNVPAFRRLTLRSIKNVGADAPKFTEVAGRNSLR